VIQCHLPKRQREHLKELGIFIGKIICIHGYDITIVDAYGKDVYKNLFDQGDLFLPISERWKNKLIYLGCCEKKIKVHRMGVDVDRYRDMRRKSHSDGKTRILTIARFVEKKGIRFGVEAVGRIVKAHPEIEYSIIGDGPLREEIVSVIDEMNLREKVKLFGWKSQEESWITDGFRHPSGPERTGQDGDQRSGRVKEAMALGVTSSATISVSSKLVKDGVSGSSLRT
jgi:colanic acid/amylovoran biosynthesis glycosyltransferase